MKSPCPVRQLFVSHVMMGEIMLQYEGDLRTDIKGNSDSQETNVMMRMCLLLLFALFFVSGCERGDSADVAALRQEVAQLRHEVVSLRGQLDESRRSEHSIRARDYERGFGSEVSSTGGVRLVRERFRRLTHEELKRRHEEMRDPEKREQLRAKHKARMEARRLHFEERRKHQEQNREMTK